MNETKEIDIDLRKVLYMMKSKIAYIIIFTLFLGIISGCYTHFFISPLYSATVKMYVYSNTDRVSTDTSITPNEITASQDLVNTYIYILESDTVMDKVIEDLNLKTDAKTLRRVVNSSKIEDAQAFQVTVNTDDPNLSAKIANSIAKIAPEEIIRIVKAGGVEVIDYAKAPSNPSSPNMKRNVFLGALLGFMISLLGFLIYELFDSTIVNAKDLEKEFAIPILGTIPSLDSNDNNAYNYYATKQADIDSNDLNSLLTKPSSELLDNIQSMKGDGK